MSIHSHCKKARVDWESYYIGFIKNHLYVFACHPQVPESFGYSSEEKKEKSQQGPSSFQHLNKQIYIQIWIKTEEFSYFTRV